jgi:hypothetical protein
MTKTFETSIKIQERQNHVKLYVFIYFYCLVDRNI